MCVDYTSLNKACSKDPFPLPQVDQVIDLTARCELFKFSRCLLELPPDTPCRGGPAHHHVHHSLRLFLLRKNAVQTKERRGHRTVVYAVLFQRTNRVQPRGLCRLHHHEVPIEQQSHR
jgi:hypothetical protein